MIFTRLVTGCVMILALLGWLLVAAPALAAADVPTSAHGDTTAGGPEHGETAEHGEGGLKPLDFKEDLAIWTAVVFLLLLAILWKFAWGPIAAGLDKREQGISDQIASAEHTNEEARKLLDEYQQKLAQSQDEIRRMFDDARGDAQKVGEQIVDKARDDAQAEHRQALSEIELATADAIKELARRSAALAVDLAGKIVDARLDPEAHTKLIEEAVANFPCTEPDNN